MRFVKSLSAIVSCLGIFFLVICNQAFSATEDIVVYSRIGERLLATLGGALCLWIGYRLFRILGESKSEIGRGGLSAISSGGALAADAEKSETTIGKPTGGGFEGKVGEYVSLKLWDVAPGIYFALFGSALLAYVMYSKIETTSFRQPQLETARHELQPEPVQTTFRFAFPNMTAQQSSAKATELVRAIRTIDDLKGGAVSQEDKERLGSAILVLRNSYPLLIDLGFGEGAYNAYERMIVLSDADKSKMPPKDQELYGAVYDAINGGV